MPGKFESPARHEMRGYARDTIMELGRLVFANLKAYNRLKAAGWSLKHPAMQFLQRERISYLRTIQELKTDWDSN